MIISKLNKSTHFKCKPFIMKERYKIDKEVLMKKISLLLKIIITIVGLSVIITQASLTSMLSISFYILILIFFMLDLFVFRKARTKS